MKEELLSLSAKCCRYNPGVFYWHNGGMLHGLITVHVDDLFWGGSKLFENKIIHPFKATFEIGKESSGFFKYLGLQIQQTKDNMTIQQTKYCQALEPIEISKERRTQKNAPLGTDELKKLRALIGQMNWVATQTRPDVLFDCSELASKLKDATVADMFNANKVLKKLRNDVVVRIPKLDDSATLKFVAYSDSSYANLKDGGSQGGFVILLTATGCDKLSPIAWQSKRIKRVVKSTLAAEMLSMVEAAEACYWLQNLTNELFGTNECNIECFIDSQSLFNAVHSMTSLLDKRLRVDVAIIREMIQRNEIQKVTWVPTKVQIADCLTKRGCCAALLLQPIISFDS